MTELIALIDRSTFLRRVLLIDAATSAAMGLLLALDANVLARLLELPAALLECSGLSLLPFAAVVAWLGTREIPPRPGVWTVIGANVLWIAGTLLLFASASIAPNALGYAFLISQAAVVALLAELEYVGLRRSAAVA
jgi:hypothetical protein